MKIIYNLNEKNIPKGGICAIGNFDGVHLGHQLIFKKLKKEAEEAKTPSIVITFNPHPLKILYPEKEIKLLCTREQKYDLISKFSIDYLIEIPFNLDFSLLSAEEFIKKYLFEKMNIKKIIIGKNFSFGYKKSGSPHTLKRLGKKYGFLVSIIKPLVRNKHIVSSTNIRKLIYEGKLEFASEMLGRLYSIKGKVVEGEKRGKKIGVPTINLELYNDLILSEGIYSGYTIIKGDKKKHLSAISIGKKPTFSGEKINVESHLIDFSKDIYGEEVELFFYSKIREQKKFKSVEELVINIKKDIEFIKSLKENILK